MAKALIGHLNGDQRGTATLMAENHRLRHRVADLEALVLRLQAENDRLITPAAVGRHGVVERGVTAIGRAGFHLADDRGAALGVEIPERDPEREIIERHSRAITGRGGRDC